MNIIQTIVMKKLFNNWFSRNSKKPVPQWSKEGKRIFDALNATDPKEIKFIKDGGGQYVTFTNDNINYTLKYAFYGHGGPYVPLGLGAEPWEEAALAKIIEMKYNDTRNQ